MRKVLLATTALVALGGVSVANAADISISGNLETNFIANDKGNSAVLDGNVVLSATTTSDAGITFEVVQNNRIEASTSKGYVIDHDDATAVANGTTAATGSKSGTGQGVSAGVSAAGNDEGVVFVGADNGRVQALYLSISSADLGELMLGNIDDDAAGAMDGALGENNDIESTGMSSGDDFRTNIAGGGTGIHWFSPSLGGLKVGLSHFPGEDASSAALTYSAGGINAYYGQNDDAQNFGVKGSVAGFTIAIGQRKNDNSNKKASDFAVKYSLDNGITLATLVANGKDTNGNSVKYSNIGASYTLTPGVTLKVEAGDDKGENFSFIGINTAF